MIEAIESNDLIRISRALNACANVEIDLTLRKEAMEIRNKIAKFRGMKKNQRKFGQQQEEPPYRSTSIMKSFELTVLTEKSSNYEISQGLSRQSSIRLRDLKGTMRNTAV